MSWRYMTLRYAWAFGVYHVLRSSRWSDEDKVLTLVVLGVLLCWPVVAAQALWLLTGRGPIRWIFRPTVAFVNPLPRWKYPEGAFARAIAAGRDIHGEIPIVPPRRRQRP